MLVWILGLKGLRHVSLISEMSVSFCYDFLDRRHILHDNAMINPMR